MVTFLPAPQPLEGFKKGIGELSDTIQQKLLSKKEGEALQKLGINLSGIKDPKMRAAIAKEQLKEKANKELLGELGLNDTAKSKLLGDGQSVGGAEGEENITPEMLKQGLPLYQRLNEDQKIKLAVRHPQLANLLQKQADSARRSDLDERKFTQGEEHFGKTFGLAEKKENRQGQEFGLTHDFNKRKAEIQQQQYDLSHELAKLKAQQQELQFEKSHGLAEKKANTQEQQFEKTHGFAQEKYGEEKKERLSAVEKKPLEKKTESFFTKLQEDADKIPQLELSIESMLDAVKNGDVDPFSQSHLADIAESFGVSPAITKIFQTVGSKEFNTARKSFLGSTLKDTFRGATTKQEINLAESLLAEVGVKPAANQAALFLLQSNLFLKKEEQRLAASAREQGISNYEIPDYVSKNLQPFQKQLFKEYIEAVRELRKKK